MEDTVKKEEPIVGPSFRELESFNLFSQGNIYTTKVARQPKWSSPTNQIHSGVPNILVGTLKPPRLLSIHFNGIKEIENSALDQERGKQINNEYKIIVTIQI